MIFGEIELWIPTAQLWNYEWLSDKLYFNSDFSSFVLNIICKLEWCASLEHPKITGCWREGDDKG